MRPAPDNPARELLGRALDRVGWDGALLDRGLSPPPTASLNYGSCGVALFLYRAASQRGDPALLALADVWARRAVDALGEDSGFYNAEIEITPETVGRISGYGGRTHSPIVDEERVVISFLNSSFAEQGKGTHRYLAMDKRTGEMLWWAAPGGTPLDTTYSVPVVAVVGGRRLLIAGNADGGIYALKARTGEKVWGFQLSQRGINSSVARTPARAALRTGL